MGKGIKKIRIAVLKWNVAPLTSHRLEIKQNKNHKVEENRENESGACCVEEKRQKMYHP